MFAKVLEARTINGQILAITVVEIVRRERRILRTAGIFDPYTITAVLAAAQGTCIVLEGGIDSGRIWGDPELQYERTFSHAASPSNFPD